MMDEIGAHLDLGANRKTVIRMILASTFIERVLGPMTAYLMNIRRQNKLRAALLLHLLGF